MVSVPMIPRNRSGPCPSYSSCSGDTKESSSAGESSMRSVGSVVREVVATISRDRCDQAGLRCDVVLVRTRAAAWASSSAREEVAEQARYLLRARSA